MAVIVVVVQAVVLHLPAAVPILSDGLKDVNDDDDDDYDDDDKDDDHDEDDGGDVGDEDAHSQVAL